VICKIEGCDAPVLARKMCSKHYDRWRAHGNPHFLMIASPGTMKNSVCKVAGCGRGAYCRGYCSGHYQRFMVRGHPVNIRGELELNERLAINENMARGRVRR
jgi:hypothetical protein